MICPKCKHDFIPDNRTSQQNKYLHAILGEIADHTGYTINEMKQVLKHELGRYHNINHVTVYDSTAEMTKDELALFIDMVTRFASDSLDMVIQTPEEYFSNSNQKPK